MLLHASSAIDVHVSADKGRYLLVGEISSTYWFVGGINKAVSFLQAKTDKKILVISQQKTQNSCEFVVTVIATQGIM